MTPPRIPQEAAFPTLAYPLPPSLSLDMEREGEKPHVIPRLGEGEASGPCRFSRICLLLSLVLAAFLGSPSAHAFPVPEALADRLAARDYRGALAGLDSLLSSADFLPRDRTQALLQRALCLKGLGRPGEALPGFQAARASFPDVEEYLARFEGECLEALDRDEEALSSYDALVKRFPGCRFRDEVRLRAARIAQRVGQAESAARRYREIVVTASDVDDVAEGLFGLASAQTSLGQPAAAAETFRSLVHDHPSSPWALKALPHLGDPKTAGACYDAGQVRFHHGQWAEAASAFRAVGAKYPKDGRVGMATYWEARAHFSAKAYGPAVAGFTASYRKYRIPDALFFLGRCAVRGDDDRLGSQRLLDFARKYPTHDNADDALWYAAWSLERIGDFDGARKAFLRLASNYSGSRNVEQSRFRACFVLYSAGRLRDAIRAFTALGDTSRGYLKDQAYFWVGKCYYRLGDPAAAGRWYARSASSFPASYYAARAALALPDKDRADLARQAFASPGAPPADDALDGYLPLPGIGGRKADLLTRLGLHPEAARELAALQLAVGDTPSALQGLLWRYERIRAYDRAMRLAARIVDLEQRAGGRLSQGVIRRLYPTYYADLIWKPAAENAVEPALVLAIIRQESAFDPSSVSGPGARGLMQIMPTTGAAWAEEMGIRNFTPESLDDPATSIRYGCREIASYLPQFPKDLRGLALALSSYNAGLDVAQRWDRALSQDVDELVENVPYHETRGYIKSVIRNYEVYKLRLRRPEDVGPAGTR